MKILLSSASPRRKEILASLIDKFEVESYESNENYTGNSPEETVIEIARRKLNAVHCPKRFDWIIVCDTLVFLDGKYYGKPDSRLMAENMLKELSGKTHKVISGLIVSSENKKIEVAISTDVTFKTLSSKDIKYYLDNFVYIDKAGAYAIQDNFLVERINGSYYNVVGLPKEELEKILKEIGVIQ